MKNRGDNCPLPSDRLYDVDNDLWYKPLGKRRHYLVGVCRPFLHFAGRPKKIIVKREGVYVKRNTALAVYISSRMEGALMPAVDCQVMKVNEDVAANPQVVADDPYEDGWLAEVSCPSEPILTEPDRAKDLYEEINNRRGVVCFAHVPHYEMRVYGESCESILTRMNDFMKQHVKVGETLHIATGDPATEVDLISWAERTGHELLGLTRRGSSLHALYRKSLD
ncbi:MAG: hypothetical protein RMH74_00480 [Candidatus Caldarchaeum sp.]|nr:hypothetical protein [Candidatus Caldarchaeum sp.]